MYKFREKEPTNERINDGKWNLPDLPSISFLELTSTIP